MYDAEDSPVIYGMVTFKFIFYRRKLEEKMKKTRAFTQFTMFTLFALMVLLALTTFVGCEPVDYVASIHLKDHDPASVMEDRKSVV